VREVRKNVGRTGEKAKGRWSDVSAKQIDGQQQRSAQRSISRAKRRHSSEPDRPRKQNSAQSLKGGAVARLLASIRSRSPARSSIRCGIGHPSCKYDLRSTRLK